MAISEKQLFYHKGSETHAISLYDSPVDTGSNTVTVFVDTQTLYAALGTTGDPNASDLRIHKNDTTWAVLFHIATGIPLTSQLGNELYEIMEITDEGMHPVTTTVNNIGWGTASPSTVAVAQGQTLTATATPFSGRTFTSWTIYTASGSSTSTSNPLSLVINSPTNIVATFS